MSTGHPGTPPAPVAVVSDGSQDPGGPGLSSVLRARARTIQEFGGPPAREFRVGARDAHELVEAVGALPDEVRAVYLVGTDAARGLTVQRDLGRRRALLPVVTEQDVAAIALAAALLTTLARRERGTATSRVVVAGGSALPNLGPLLMATRIFDISFWNEADARHLPLERAARGTDAVLDLRTGQRGELRATHRTGPAVLALDDVAECAAPLPGLLNAIAETPLATVDIDIYAAVARALSALAPPGEDLPALDHALADSIGWAAHQTLLHPRIT